jgi:hypothetical protein
MSVMPALKTNTRLEHQWFFTICATLCAAHVFVDTKASSHAALATRRLLRP